MWTYFGTKILFQVIVFLIHTMPLSTLEFDLVGQVELLDLCFLFGQRLPPPPKQPGQQVRGRRSPVLVPELLGARCGGAAGRGGGRGGEGGGRG